MKGKYIITGVVLLICLVGSALCFIYYNGRISGTGVETTTTKSADPKKFDDQDFNYRLLKTVNSVNKDNYLVSPYSIQVALSMVRDGANGKTQEEINNLIGTTPSKINNTNIKISNAMFLKDNYKDYIIPTFSSKLANDYNADVLLDKFTTPKVINDWVNKKTDGMISKLLNQMDPDFVLGLANAIAIDVKWQNQFECTSTVEAEFTKKDNSKMKTEMMKATYEYGTVKYLSNDKAVGVVLPYEEATNLEYVAILPNGDLDDYINSFNGTELNNLLSNAKTASNKLHINLSIPRYTYDYEYEGFADGLKSMGMTTAFDPEKADFTNIISRENMSNTGNLYISQAIHKTHIELNEAGTKAAAVTYFGFTKNASISTEKFETVDVNLNKTFLYMIREKTTGSILFAGVVNSPNEWKGTTCKKDAE